MSDTDEPETIDLTYEQARDELVAIVHKLETGGTTLAESLTLWQRGEELADICQTWLDGAREKLEGAVGEPDQED